MSKERLEEIKEIWDWDRANPLEAMNINQLQWLIKQTERVEELESRNKELEYASKYNGELNKFLQKRNLPPKTLGRHVVDVVMDYVEELEEHKELSLEMEKAYEHTKMLNLCYKRALEFYANKDNYDCPHIGKLENGTPVYDTSIVENDGGRKAREVLGEL